MDTDKINDKTCVFTNTTTFPTHIQVNASCGGSSPYNITGNTTAYEINYYAIFGDVAPDALHGCLTYSLVVDAIVIGLACVLGLIGNSVAQWVFWKDKILTASLMLFRCLLISDSAVLLASFPHVSVTSLVYYSGGVPGYFNVLPYIQVYVFPLAFMAHVCSVWFTVLIGYSRYIAVIHPHMTRICAVKRMKKCLLAVLAAVAVYCGPKFFEYTVHCVSLPGRNECVPWPIPSVMVNAEWYRIVHRNILYAVFMSVLPQGIMIYQYVKIIIELRSSSIRSNQSPDHNDHVARAIVYIVASTVVSQTPALVTQILWNTLSHSARECGGVQFYMSPISNALVILNSAQSLPIHFAFNTRFRELIGKSKDVNPAPESHALVSV